MTGKDTDIARDGRRDRLIEERIHDPYKPRGQLPEPSQCTECGAVYSGGRWQWQVDPPEGAKPTVCPACKRIRDRVPAGFLTLSGPFFESHREEILNLVHNKVGTEKAQHPMKRIMRIEEEEEGTVVSFTDIHLPRGVGVAVESAYEGELEIKFTEHAGLLRATWRR
jgi:NMD protein affecting ribosome stability and mRNA decay